MESLLARAAIGEETDRPPVWLMRQAGRYLPRYREIREGISFRDAISTPDIAEEISLLPLERFGVDGVVMYSDILVVLDVLGFNFKIEKGVGPVVDSPVSKPHEAYIEPSDPAEIGYVYELIEKLTESVPSDKAVIGFTGAPYTIARYLVDGGEKDTKRFMAKHPEAFTVLLDSISEVVSRYAALQVEAGADVIQVFDTWAGDLSSGDYEEYAYPYHQEIVDEVEAPVIGFTRHSSSKLGFLESTGFDVAGLDWSVEIQSAREELGDIAVQGNMDPMHLFGSLEEIRDEVLGIIKRAGGCGHILNLGHGVHRDTPIDAVEVFVDTAKSYRY